MNPNKENQDYIWNQFLIQIWSLSNGVKLIIMILVSVSVRKFVYGLQSKQYSSKESSNRSKMFTTDVKKSQIYASDSSKRSKLHNREA